MDRPERAQATGDARGRQSTPGPTPEPEQAVFRGRRVAEMPGPGPSPSRTEPQTSRASAGVSQSHRVSVIREVGRAGRRFQPYSAGKPGQRPGTSRLPAGEPSVPPVPRGGGQEPELPARFNWAFVYEGIIARREIDAERGDIYAVAASDSALGAITQAVTGANSTHLSNPPKRAPSNFTDPLQALRNALNNAKRRADRPGAEAIQRSLDDIFLLTHARDTELKLRSAEFRSASLPRAIPVPGREALERWLRTQASAAGTDIEHSYFTRLAQDLPSGRDPWMVSRELMGSLPSPGDAQQAGRLQAAHRRLVRAIACGLSEQRSESGDPELPSHFNWQTVYKAIRARMERDRGGADIYAAAASAAALLDIDHAVRYAHFTHRLQGSSVQLSGMAQNLNQLRALHRSVRRFGNPDRAEAIQRSLDYIYRLTHARHKELERRSEEFRSASFSRAVPVPGREALEGWLRARAAAMPGTDKEHAYFTHLAQALPGGHDPWTVSRELLRSLPGAGDKQQAERLQAAHRRLVQAMAGNLSQQPDVSAPGVAQASGESRAPLSMQQGIVGRLKSRNPLSEWQVEVIMSAVKRAIDSGSLDVSTSQPENWARGLVDRVQASVPRPIGELSESGRERESSDLERLDKLVEKLEGQGYL